MALLGGVLVGLAALVVVDRSVRLTAQEKTRRLARTLAQALVEPVVRGDVWQTYQIVRAAGASFPDEPSEVVVLGDDERVLAASLPLRYPLGLHVSGLPAHLAQAARLSQQTERDVMLLPWVAGERQPVLVMAEPIVGEEGLQLGTVLAVHPSGLTTRQREPLLQRMAGVGAVSLAVAAVVGAWLGWRLARPIVALRDSMRKVGHSDEWAQPWLDQALQPLLQRRDDVGDLARAYAAMLRQLDAQRHLQRHVLEAERLARVGQLSASIAHEVNNPIGGMLAALDNRRLRGGLDDATARTLDVLERGLRHIHATVQALLNEARGEQHALQPQDLDDMHTLLLPMAERAGVALRWQLNSPTLALPALTVRQVVLNLCLNALTAAGRGGQVLVHGRATAQGWRLRVANTGAALTQASFDALVRGQGWQGQGRVGLGLWVSARLMADHGGRLVLVSEPPWATVLEALFVPAPDPAGVADALPTQGPEPTGSTPW